MIKNKTKKYVKAISTYGTFITNSYYYVFIKKINSNRFGTCIGILIENNEGDLRAYDSKFFEND